MRKIAGSVRIVGLKNLGTKPKQREKMMTKPLWKWALLIGGVVITWIFCMHWFSNHYITATIVTVAMWVLAFVIPTNKISTKNRKYCSILVVSGMFILLILVALGILK